MAQVEIVGPSGRIVIDTDDLDQYEAVGFVPVDETASEETLVES